MELDNKLKEGLESIRAAVNTFEEELSKAEDAGSL